ncbi:hypothetical protein [Bifidobacterium choerinum]|uniref:Uncharacterized protein n=1 Tax=Bifidobacterium choerinum TaxID=35760 RepID=A0A2D3D6P5_9BIFI|nr:hypothetical protein [Bifidobacterium choerinum]ATU20807.1 hypothetical protein BcFMB_07610 [Bifidobacterium choerinum]
MITNLCKTPNGTVASSYQYKTERRQEASGKWSYRVNNTSGAAGTFAFKMGTSRLMVGGWLVCVYSCADPLALTSIFDSRYGRIGGTVIETTIGGVISDTMGWVAAQVAELSENEIWIEKTDGWVTLEGCAAFTEEDWRHMLEYYRNGILTFPWVDGETLKAGGVGLPHSIPCHHPHLGVEVAA